MSDAQDFLPGFDPQEDPNGPCDPIHILPARQARFVEEYCKDANASKAAMRAGYSPNGSGVQGHRLLNDANVAAAIHIRREQLAQAAAVESIDVIREIARIAFADIRNVVDPDTGVPRELHELDADTAKTIASVEIKDLYSGQGEDRISIGREYKYKFWDKNPALDKLMRFLGQYKRDNEQVADPLGNLLKFVQDRNVGLPLPIRGNDAPAPTTYGPIGGLS